MVVAIVAEGIANTAAEVSGTIIATEATTTITGGVIAEDLVNTDHDINSQPVPRQSDDPLASRLAKQSCSCCSPWCSSLARPASRCNREVCTL
jgi:hypothetical protein